MLEIIYEKISFLAKKKWKSASPLMKILLIGLGIYAVFSTGTSIFIEDAQSSKTPTPVVQTFGNNNADKFTAYSYAEECVENNIKSPNSAKYPGITEKINHITYIKENHFKITSWVDSKNSFGVMIRSNFVCEIVFKDGSVFCKSIVFL